MKIALAQLSAGSDIDQNVEKSLEMTEVAAGKGAELICFPEVQFYPFFPQYPGRDAHDYALELDDPVIKRLQEKSRELNIISVPNFYLKEGNKKYDASIVINNNGEITGISGMVHIVQMEKFYEQDYYAPFDDGFKVYDTPYCKPGIVICYDRHFPESIRCCALQGAELIIVPTANLKEEPRDLFEWEMRIQSMHNNVFIAICNRVGKEGAMDFCGESLVTDPYGNVLNKADDTEQILYSELDFSLIPRARKVRPYLKLRRPEVYRHLSR